MLKRYGELLRRLGAKHSPTESFNRIEHDYANPHRAYHNLGHVAQCLNALDDYVKNTNDLYTRRPRPENLLLVETALWFHDAIYVPGAPDNEEMSAWLGYTTLEQMGVRPSFCKGVSDAIVATKHDTMPQGIDAQLTCDIDLFGLAEPYDSFMRTGERIKSEYVEHLHITDEQWRAGRKAFAHAMRNLPGGKRPTIFSTQYFQRYESKAQDNLKRLEESL